MISTTIKGVPVLKTKPFNFIQKTSKAVFTAAVLPLVAISLTAHAGKPASQYHAELIEGPFPANSPIPELPFTELTDVSSNGMAVFYSETLTPDFKNLYVTGLYDIKKGSYTILGSGEYSGPDIIDQSGFNAYGVNAPGALVGGESCDIIDKKGNVTQPPIPPDSAVCSTRGISSKGMVSGFTIDNGGIWRGFAYDTKSGSYEEFLPDPDRTLAQGINSKGDIVGGTGPFADRDGFVRDSDGTVRFFRVNIDGVRYPTAARGISANGTIAGVYFPDGGESTGFVGRLSNDPDDHNLFPDAVFTPETVPECVSVFISRINNKGVISGLCYISDDGFAKGLLLSPLPPGKAK